ncbi:MAG TPA: tripartite tricarboxylate transporter substrate binding protein [Xanthobacteraceae bacterium]|jgi:tripartite-type tricarboxylate transporter receptor subunit TctC|nr:tripartite tricarboxylate transporter substrate binding protein [Xanthobacteraceae bacterium]
MEFPRRKFLHLAAGAAAVPAFSGGASALDYPNRPVKILVGFSAGGAVDVVARLIGDWLSRRLHGEFLVEDRPGAANNLATEAMIRSPADGYTLLLTNPTNAINATYYAHLNYNFLRDSDPVAGIMRVPNVLVVGPAVPAHTVPEFIAYAKANAGKVYYASPGNGTSPHMSMEMFKLMANIQLNNITYRGMNGGAYADLLSGRVQAAFDNLPGSIGYIRNGQFRALGVTTATRSDALPDTPSISDFLPGYEVSAFYGLNAPKGTPADVIDILNKAVNAAIADPGLKKKFADLGGMMIGGSPADFGKFLTGETDKWAKVIHEANLKLME